MTTATDWLTEHPEDLETLTQALINAGVDMKVWTELPEWMKEEIANQLIESFSQPYWLDIHNITLGHAEDFIEHGLMEGWSIRRIAEEMATKFQEGTAKYALMRAKRIARTESGNALNGARDAALNRLREELPADVSQYIRKGWHSVLGNTTRDTHAALDGVPADAEGMWDLAGYRIPWPSHLSLPPEHRVNCQCTLVTMWGMKEDDARRLIDEYYQFLEEHEVGKSYDGRKYPGQPRDSHGRFASGRSGSIEAVMRHQNPDTLHNLIDGWENPPDWQHRTYGGVLVNDKGEVLLREPANHWGGYVWTFAKGSLESPDEHPVDVAKREVAEETGHKGRIEGALEQGFVKGDGQDGWKNYYFVMKSEGHDPGRMDAETSSTRWASYSEAKKLLSRTRDPQGRQRDLDVLEAAHSSIPEMKGKSFLKHLPGQHNQMSHGRGGGFGMRPSQEELELHDKLYEEHAKVINGAPKEQKEALRYYMRQGSGQVAAASRGFDKTTRGDSVSPKAKKSAELLEGLVSSSTLPVDVVAYRGDSRLPNDEEAAKSLIGSSVSNPGVCSMSIRGHVGVQFAGGGGVLRVELPKGSKGLYAEAMWQSKKAQQLRRKGELGEAEVLPPFGTNFRITSVEKITNAFDEKQMVYHAVVVGGGEKAKKLELGLLWFDKLDEARRGREEPKSFVDLFEKHLPKQHNQMTHGHGGVVGEASGIDTSGWANHSVAKWAEKKIKMMEAAYEAGTTSNIQKIKVKGCGSLAEALASGKSFDKYDKAILKAKDTLLGKTQKGIQESPEIKGLKYKNATTIDGDGWKQIGPKLGTQPGGTFEGADGKKYYVKFPDDPKAAVNEVMAFKLYKAAGANIQDANLIEVGGKLGIAREWEPNAQKADWGDKFVQQDAGKDFAAHAWLANWDCVGAGSEKPAQNIMNVYAGDHKGMLIVDPGGALGFKGTGVPKPAKAFGNDATEWDTLRDSGVNPSAAMAFKGMTKQQLIESAANVEGVSGATIQAITAKYLGTQEGALLGNKMIARRDFIKAKADALKSADAEQLKKVTPKQAVSPEGKTVDVKSVGPSVPPPPVIANKSWWGQHYQNKVNELHDMAEAGNWEGVAAYSTKSKGGLAKYAQDYQKQLLAGKDLGSPVQPKPAGDKIKAPTKPPKIDSKQFPKKLAIWQDPEHIKQNNAHMDEVLKHAKKGDLDAIKTMSKSPSGKVEAWKQEVMSNLSYQLNPPPPPKKISGAIGEIDAKAAPVLGPKGMGASKVGDYLVLADVSPMPAGVDAKGNWVTNPGWTKGKNSWNKLTGQEKVQSKNIMDSSFKSAKVNTELRKDKPLSDATLAAAAGITKASIPLKPGIMLDRGLKMPLSEAAKFKPGQVLQDRGCIHTSVVKDKWSGNVRFRMLVTEGVRGLPASSISIHTKEREVTLPPNTRTLVTKVYQLGEKMMVVESVLLPFHEGQCCPP